MYKQLRTSFQHVLKLWQPWLGEYIT